MILKYFYVTLGCLFVFIGVVGVFLPILPTTPFLLVAAFFFSKGSDKFYLWLIHHKYLGPPIQDWKTNGVIRKPHKIFATITMSMSGVFILSQSRIPMIGKVSFFVTISVVLFFIWTRPSYPKQD